MKIIFVNDEEKEQISRQLLEGTTSLEESVGEYEARLIRQALVITGGNKARAAELLGVPASTLKSKIKKHAIS